MNGERLAALSDPTAPFGRLSFVEHIPFGPKLVLDRYRLENGLSILMLVDRSAPVIAYHTWFRVGSRHEKPGKTGLAHLLEHLMFVEFEGLPGGAFDAKMEEIGAENNASTWLDFTQYQEAFPKAHLTTVAQLEATRMAKLLLSPDLVESEKEVVMNERRYRVDDDVEGRLEELLWGTAFQQHTYHHPTIGWMPDIEGFTAADCEAFYRTYYAPNNASLILVGDLDPAKTLRLLSRAYGHIPPSELPIEDVLPEPVQTAQRSHELELPTATEKVALAFKGPALGDFDHVACSVLTELLAGSRSSRLFRQLISDLGLVAEVRASVGPHRDPSLIEIFLSMRQGKRAEVGLGLVLEEIERLKREPVAPSEIERAVARSELSLLGSLETADGKASTIGFHECLSGQPGEAFTRLSAMRRVQPSDVLRVARRYLIADSSTLVVGRPSAAAVPASEVAS
jgi:zinc protease